MAQLPLGYGHPRCLEEHGCQRVSKGVYPDSLTLVRNLERVERGMKDGLHDFVPAERPAPTVHEDKFVVVVGL